MLAETEAAWNQRYVEYYNDDYNYHDEYINHDDHRRLTKLIFLGLFGDDDDDDDEPEKEGDPGFKIFFRD